MVRQGRHGEVGSGMDRRVMAGCGLAGVVRLGALWYGRRGSAW